MKPVCVPCQRFYRIKKNGYYFIEGMPHGDLENDIPWDGKSGKDSVGWIPYKLWVGDLWECPDCKAQIVTGVTKNRIAEHYEVTFTQQIQHCNPQLFVKDC